MVEKGLIAIEMRIEQMTVTNDGWTKARTDGRTDRQTDGQTDGWTDRRVYWNSGAPQLSEEDLFSNL